jgi:hypothetical protein
MRSGDTQDLDNLARHVHNLRRDHVCTRRDHMSDRCSMCSRDRSRRT